MKEPEYVKRDKLNLPILEASDFLNQLANRIQEQAQYERFKFLRDGRAGIASDLETEFDAVTNLKRLADSLKWQAVPDCIVPENPRLNPWVSDAIYQAGIDLKRVSLEFHSIYGWILSPEDTDCLNSMFVESNCEFDGLALSQFLETGSLHFLKDLAETFSNS